MHDGFHGHWLQDIQDFAEFVRSLQTIGLRVKKAQGECGWDYF
jgi:hypothetical protein